MSGKSLFDPWISCHPVEANNLVSQILWSHDGHSSVAHDFSCRIFTLWVGVGRGHVLRVCHTKLSYLWKVVIFTALVFLVLWYCLNVYLFAIHVAKRKPHLSVAENWYQFDVIVILQQPLMTDSANIKTRLHTRLCFYQTRSAWSMDQRSNKKDSAVHNFAPTVTKFCVIWEPSHMTQNLVTVGAKF